MDGLDFSQLGHIQTRVMSLRCVDEVKTPTFHEQRTASMFTFISPSNKVELN